MLTPLILALATLPAVISDPRQGPSTWACVLPQAASSAPEAAGYLAPLPAPPAAPDETWLKGVVMLAARARPVVAVGAAVPAALLPYLDGVCVEPVPREGVESLLGQLTGTPLVLPAEDGAAAVTLLGAGASAVLVEDPPASWANELVGLLPEPSAARQGSLSLATAVRATDLALVVGLPRGFPGGVVELPSTDVASAVLLGEISEAVPLSRTAAALHVTLPALPKGGVVLLQRARTAKQAFEHVGVSAEGLPEVAEVLARHQRFAARQELLVSRFSARQRLLVRVWVEQLARSFEVVLAGPAFYEHALGTDWEIAEAWVDGVRWDPESLPDLPLLEPSRPPVPPLALQLRSSYRYTIEGQDRRQGRDCYVLSFVDLDPAGPGTRRGRAFIDKVTYGLVELEVVAEGLVGEVRSTRSVTEFRLTPRGAAPLWLPSRVVADDLVSAFGGAATVHRELDLSELAVDPDELDAGRAAAWAGPHRMLRDAPSGVVPLYPDGHGGRTVEPGRRVSQRFLLGGMVYDPGLKYPLPFGGLQVQDFDFRGKGQQLRLLVAGVINDGVWVARQGRLELSLRAFLQPLPFVNSVYEDGEELEGEEIRTTRQRLGAAAVTTVGPVRLALDLGVDRLDFWTTDTTADEFVLPTDTFEGVARLDAGAALGAFTLSLAGEAGYRERWEAWGPYGHEQPERAWQRGRLAVVWERSLLNLAKLHLDAELAAGRHLDRFSAATPARFGGLRLRGIASSRTIPEAIAVVRGSVALPLSRKIRGELGVDMAWAREERSGYHARPLSGIGIGLTAPGPWGTLLETSAGVAMATPGKRSPTFDLLILKPLGRKGQ